MKYVTHLNHDLMHWNIRFYIKTLNYATNNGQVRFFAD